MLQPDFLTSYCPLFSPSIPHLFPLAPIEGMLMSLKRNIEEVNRDVKRLKIQPSGALLTFFGMFDFFSILILLLDYKPHDTIL